MQPLKATCHFEMVKNNDKLRHLETKNIIALTLLGHVVTNVVDFIFISILCLS